MLLPHPRVLDQRDGGPPRAAAPLAFDGDPALRPSIARPTVLVVEDNPDHADLVRVMLAHARGPRWGVTTVPSLGEAAAWLARDRADVALLDLNLPDSRGAATAGRLCREHPELPVVIYTALTDEEVALEGLQQGAQDHLVKGQFDGVILTRTLRFAIERKRAELAHAQLAAIVENSDDAIVRVALDGVILSWNPGAVRMYGYAAGEALGRPLEILSPHDAPDEVRRAASRVRRGERVEPFETSLRRKDGRLIEVSLAVSPIRDEAGRVGAISVIGRDLGEVTRARRALQRREEEFRLLFECNPHPMWVFDRETTRFLEVNRAAVEHYGYSREEFLGLCLADIRPAEDVARLEEHLAEPRLGAFAFGTWRHLKKDGRVIDVEVTGHDIEFAGRQGRVIVAHDVTDRNQLQAQLLQSQKMEAIGRLAGGIAHDFNNLLGVITGYTALLRRDLPEGRPQERADEVLKAAEKAAALTRQLLAFSRKQVVQPKVIHLNHALADMEAMLRRVVGEDIQVVVLYDEALGRLRADPSQVEQVLLNLVVNARDAMPRGGRLIIETSNVRLDRPYAASHAGVPPGRYVMLAVSDTGVGMTPEVAARIFEPFFTTKEGGKGTGLGLATVYGIVKQGGGHLFVYSEPGQGTTFKVYFPRTDEPADAVATAALAGARGGTETVLLVEDDPSLRAIVREMLEEKGYRVLPAEGATDAVDMAEQGEQAIDLLLTDMVMPRASGQALARRLLQARPGLRVVYMSGYTDEKVAQEGALQPGDHFIEKPFDQESLLREVRSALDA